MMHITRRFRRDPIVGECGAVLDETDAYTADMVVYRRALERLEGCVGCASAMLVHADPDGRVDQDGEVLPELRRAEIAAAVAMTRAGDAERACANEMDAVYDGPGAAIEEAAEQALLMAGRAHAAAHRCRAAAARSRAGGRGFDAFCSAIATAADADNAANAAFVRAARAFRQLGPDGPDPGAALEAVAHPDPAVRA